MRFLFWLILFFFLFGIVRRVIAWLLGGFARPPLQRTSGHGGPESAEASRKLVRDPVCGTYVAESLAIPLRTNGEIQYFCSTECRDKFLNAADKVAANQ